MHNPLRIAVAGLGTVGSSVVRIIQNEKLSLFDKAGSDLVVSAVSARDKNRDRGVDLANIDWHDDAKNLIQDNIDILVEVIGGADGVAYDIVKAALGKGISVVTANKALLAVHGSELAQLAEQNNAHLKYEAAVAGAIPAIKAVREGLAANQITSIYGILNGTCNYILTQMRETGGSFNEILKEAQDKGYAEADPSFDIDGVDTAHKTALLAAAAFNMAPDFNHIPTRGIRHVTSTDICYAEDLGYKIKLLGVVRKTDLGIEQSVEPCLVDLNTPLAAIDGSLNAVYTESPFAHETLMVGRGAGGDPTASAVVADIIDIARGVHISPFGVPSEKWNDTPMADMDERMVASYIRLIVEDSPGVLADISGILRDENISIQSALQLSEITKGIVPLILITHTVKTKALKGALAKIEKLRSVKEQPFTMRIIEQE